MPEEKPPEDHHADRDQRSARPRRAAATQTPRSGSARRRMVRRQRAQHVRAVDEKVAEEPAEKTPASEGTSESPSRPSKGRPGWHSLLRPGRGQVIAAVILLIVGMAGVMQIRMNREDDTYSNARREDLIQLLDGLGQESRRLENEIADLEKTRNNLASGADTERVARAEADRRIEMLSILAGTMPAEGPGIRVEITDPDNKMTADVVLDAVEEMRDAGAEVIEFNNSVRVVGSSWFGSDADGLTVDGKQVKGPIVIEVIGDPHSLEEGARFRGGMVSEITGPKVGGTVEIQQDNLIKIDSLHPPSKPQYAQPASPPPTPR